jgi:hypothetical protein
MFRRHRTGVTTWIRVAELHYGAAKSRAPEKNRGLAKSFLATLPILGGYM